MSGPRRRRASNERLPVVLALSGLEPSGRAGLLADLETIRLARGRAAGIATALTAQGKQIFVVAPSKFSGSKAAVPIWQP